MSGHSKWANIKHKKGATDAKRGKIFTKIAREIMISARLSGGDPGSNPRLRLAIQQGRSVNMPNENIKRAIQKGTGEMEGQQLEEITLEGYGPGGIGILMEFVTDNRNRTVADVRRILSRNGGSMADAGAVAWNFVRKTMISVDKGDKSEEDVLMAVLDAGADDVKSSDDTYDVYAPVENFESVRSALEDAGFNVTAASLQYLPGQTLTLTGEDAATAVKLLDLLDDYDDLQNLYTNLEVDEEEMMGLEG
jgi:YebC/PmpR family DNA-binding regulatory protein